MGETMKPYISKATKRLGKIIDKVITRLVEQNYDTAKSYYNYKLRLADTRSAGPPLLIFQMGKVGSSSVQRSLRALNLDMSIYHPHFLTPDYMTIYEEKRRQLLGTDRAGDLKHIWECQYLSEQINKRVNGRKWRVLTLVREPIARNISAFFETLEVEPLEARDHYRIKAGHKSLYHFDITVSLDHLEELVDLFLKEFDHDTPLVFFDREIKGVLGIDVYDGEFPKEKGYQIYRGDQVDVLLMRLESLNECVGDALKEFLNIDNFTLLNTNIGSQKVYAPIYQKLKDSLTLPDSYIEQMLGSRYARQFYTEAEISQFKAKWRT